MDHIFDYSFLKKSSVKPDVVNRLSRLEAFNSRASFLRDSAESIVESMERIALLDSVISSNAIEGITTAAERAAPLVFGNTRPQGHSESEISGYRRALQHIHENHSTIILSKETILEIYGILMSDSLDMEVSFKTRDNMVVERSSDGTIVAVHHTVPFQDVESSIDHMVISYWEARNDVGINKLLLIPCFILDFLRIHPFLDGNGRMSRLLTTLLLYQEGYDICRYVSLESMINMSKSDYYDAIGKSEIGWFENNNDYTPFTDFFLSILFLAYREYDHRLTSVSRNSRRSDKVRLLINNLNYPVSKRDILSMFPDLSEVTVERTLREMLDEGSVKKIGSTRGARYVRNDRKIG